MAVTRTSVTLTYFVRHTAALDIDDSTRQMLWDSQRIAIHFPNDSQGILQAQDSESLDPLQYVGSARNAMTALVNLARSGGYVCAQYHGHENSLVGWIEPESKIEILHGRWGAVHNLVGRIAALKAIQLQRVKQITPFSSAAILVGRPRQGTMMRWPSAGQNIENLVEGRSADFDIGRLLPGQQEVLCSEFLRLPEAGMLGLPILSHLLLPLGRTMKDIDIYGLANDGKRIFGQITYKALDHVRCKVERLLAYSDTESPHLILFCKTDCVSKVSGVTIAPIDLVASQFRLTKMGNEWFAHIS